MLDFLLSWAQQLIISIIIIIIIEMVIPSNSSYRKYIKVVLGIFLLYVIISPILSNKLENINFEKTFAVENIPNVGETNSIDYEKQITEAYKTNLKENMKAYLKEKGYDLVKIESDLKYDSEEIAINKISLKVKKISERKNIAVNKIDIKNNEKISTQEIYELVQEISTYYGIEENKISITESEMRK